MTDTSKPRTGKTEHIDITYDYAVCAWARHFNVSQASVKAAVAAVGAEASRVRDHLQAASAPVSERPSGH